MWTKQAAQGVEVLAVKNVSRVLHLAEHRALHVEWLRFDDDAGFAETMLRGLELARSLNALAWIADTRGTLGSMSLESQNLLRELHASGAGPRTGLVAVLTVQSRQLLSHLSNQWWHREISNGMYIVESVASLEDALASATLIKDKIEALATKATG